MNPLIKITEKGFEILADNSTYDLTWVDQMLKVTGENTCYYLVETIKGLEKADCMLTTFTLIIPN